MTEKIKKNPDKEIFKRMKVAGFITSTSFSVIAAMADDGSHLFGLSSGLAFFCGIIGTSVGMSFGLAFGAGIVAACVATIAVVGLLGPGYFGFSIPWFLPALSLLSSAAIVIRIRNVWFQHKITLLTGALSGRISPERIDSILRNPNLLQLEPTGRVISIMFIDIEGFSQIAERVSPQQAFMDLKELFDLMRMNVLRHDGMIDKTMGDGMLCFFGYGPDGKSTPRDHAFDALSCAIEIQRSVLERNMTASKSSKAIYPLRIGINTSSVFIGNIGSDSYFDFTLIGNGVNLAKRFESACQHYCVMIGATTFDLLVGQQDIPAKLTKKLIPLKHSEAHFEAYECDPFYDQEKYLNEVTAAYRKSLGIVRKDTRWPVPNDVVISCDSEFGAGRLYDFSISGFSVLLPAYVGNGVTIDLDLSIPDEFRHQRLGPLLSLYVEVRWGRPSHGGFLHGVMIKNLSAVQKDDLIEVLRSIVRRSSTESLSVS